MQAYKNMREPESDSVFYHGSKAVLEKEVLIIPGYISNYGSRKIAKYVYFTGTLDAAIWGAELASGEGPGKIYIVEPTGQYQDDPNLTDRKFPGNPTRSFRTMEPLRVVGEITEWQPHSKEHIKTMKMHLDKLKEIGTEAIED